MLLAVLCPVLRCAALPFPALLSRKRRISQTRNSCASSTLELKRSAWDQDAGTHPWPRATSGYIMYVEHRKEKIGIRPIDRKRETQLLPQPKHREQFAHRSSITRRAHDEARSRMRDAAVKNAFYGTGREAAVLDEVDVHAWRQERRRQSFLAQY